MVTKDLSDMTKPYYENRRKAKAAALSFNKSPAELPVTTQAGEAGPSTLRASTPLPSLSFEVDQLLENLPETLVQPFSKATQIRQAIQSGKAHLAPRLSIVCAALLSVSKEKPELSDEDSVVAKGLATALADDIGAEILADGTLASLLRVEAE